MPGAGADHWFAIYASKGPLADRASRLGRTLASVPAQSVQLVNLPHKGHVVGSGDAQRLAAWTASERVKWGAVVKAANITI